MTKWTQDAIDAPHTQRELDEIPQGVGLVKRLRDLQAKWMTPTILEAADRIEQLERELAEVREGWNVVMPNAARDAEIERLTAERDAAWTAAQEVAAVTLDRKADVLASEASNFRGGSSPHHERMSMAVAARAYAASIRALRRDGGAE